MPQGVPKSHRQIVLRSSAARAGIAKALNKRAIPTPRGVGEWRAIQVARVLARLPA
jgi:hypothetical protein